jgi:hypothetical protein
MNYTVDEPHRRKRYATQVLAAIAERVKSPSIIYW